MGGKGRCCCLCALLWFLCNDFVRVAVFVGAMDGHNILLGRGNYVVRTEYSAVCQDYARYRYLVLCMSYFVCVVAVRVCKGVGGEDLSLIFMPWRDGKTDEKSVACTKNASRACAFIAKDVKNIPRDITRTAVLKCSCSPVALL